MAENALNNQERPADLMAELLAIRNQMQALMIRCDRLLAAQTSSRPDSDLLARQARYRATPGGVLSQEGVLEIQCRLDAGETDAMIARAMGISVQGVAKRRARKASLNERRHLHGILAGKIHMAPDFDELPNADLDAMEGEG